MPSLGLDVAINNRHQITQTDTTGQSATVTAADLDDLLRTDLSVMWDIGASVLGKKAGNYEATLNVRNLFDSEIASTSVYDYAGGVPEAGRHLQLALSARF